MLSCVVCGGVALSVGDAESVEDAKSVVDAESVALALVLETEMVGAADANAPMPVSAGVGWRIVVAPVAADMNASKSLGAGAAGAFIALRWERRVSISVGCGWWEGGNQCSPDHAACTVERHGGVLRTVEPYSYGNAC